ncbi:septum site-determining protein MinC [Swaminathania salitolerans]|uniref:Probable septum site-determining protein MinC n=1 Tax=Swaminathania salitolerans TaxID=182838 RepID=A0A511BRQ8_9PROT|nr:septum site-determining protein MinC [Swaminathania salitolerans]GBQ14378.1 septum formation inhibitor [Swaminathania salitolerans LMG 21291]GEL03016.1 putative septum site-determining protein MinC [Swaminathania salitolerans]
MRIRARGRSFLALVLSPEAPLSDWMAGLDHQISHSVGFFSGRPVILDLGLVSEQTVDLSGLQQALVERGIHIIGIEGAHPDWPALAGWDWPVQLDGGRASGAVELPANGTGAPRHGSDADGHDPARDETACGAAGDGAYDDPSRKAETLFLDRPIRSGQSVMHLDGDIVVIGSVASGAELMASGSIHVHGVLRGRAIAGVGGQSGARILATRMQAELLAIDGFYMTADEMDQTVHDQSAQAFLQDGRVTVSKLA